MRFALPTTTTLKIFFEIFSLQVDALQTSASDATNEKKEKSCAKKKKHPALKNQSRVERFLIKEGPRNFGHNISVGSKSETFPLGALIYHLAVSVKILNAELHRTLVGDCVRKLPRQSVYNLIHVAETDVAHLRKNLTTEIRPCIDHHLG